MSDDAEKLINKLHADRAYDVYEPTPSTHYVLKSSLSDEQVQVEHAPTMGEWCERENGGMLLINCELYAENAEKVLMFLRELLVEKTCISEN